MYFFVHYILWIDKDMSPVQRYKKSCNRNACSLFLFRRISNLSSLCPCSAGYPVPADLQFAGSPGLAQNVGRSSGQQKLRSDKFCEIGPATACKADYPAHIAPKSPQEHRLGSVVLSELIINQFFKLVRCSQVLALVQEDLQIRLNERFAGTTLHGFA